MLLADFVNSRRLCIIGAGLCVLVACDSLRCRAAPFQMVSVRDPSQSAPAGGSGDSFGPIMTPDGRYVLFASTANNLVLNNNSNPIPALVPAHLNVFLRDRTNGTTAL